MQRTEWFETQCSWVLLDLVRPVCSVSIQYSEIHRDIYRIVKSKKSTIIFSSSNFQLSMNMDTQVKSGDHEVARQVHLWSIFITAYSTYLVSTVLILRQL